MRPSILHAYEPTTRAATHPEEDILPAGVADMVARRRRAISSARPCCCGRAWAALVKALLPTLPAAVAPPPLLPRGTGATNPSVRSKTVIRTAMNDTVVNFMGAMTVRAWLVCLLLRWSGWCVSGGDTTEGGR